MSRAKHFLQKDCAAVSVLGRRNCGSKGRFLTGRLTFHPNKHSKSAASNTQRELMMSAFGGQLKRSYPPRSHQRLGFLFE